MQETTDEDEGEAEEMHRRQRERQYCGSDSEYVLCTAPYMYRKIGKKNRLCVLDRRYAGRRSGPVIKFTTSRKMPCHFIFGSLPVRYGDCSCSEDDCDCNCDY